MLDQHSGIERICCLFRPGIGLLGDRLHLKRHVGRVQPLRPAGKGAHQPGTVEQGLIVRREQLAILWVKHREPTFREHLGLRIARPFQCRLCQSINAVVAAAMTADGTAVVILI